MAVCLIVAMTKVLFPETLGFKDGKSPWHWFSLIPGVIAVAAISGRWMWFHKHGELKPARLTFGTIESFEGATWRDYSNYSVGRICRGPSSR
ncbi:MAG: hypothetical protein QG622_3128 [Actinomycetota bacterium]|nr:hypothetical protein [Actinomycetota bacterium]